MKKFLKLALAVAALATMFGFASCSNGSSDDSTGTGGGATTPTASIELKYTDAELADKIFSYEGDNGTKYLIFTGGNGYNVSDPDATIDSNTPADSPVIVKYNGNLYKAGKYTRQSGSGLFTTWNPNEGNISFTFNADGTGTAGGSNSFTFTNNAGVLTMTAGTNSYTAYYDGNYIYFDPKELTYVKAYTAE